MGHQQLAKSRVSYRRQKYLNRLSVRLSYFFLHKNFDGACGGN